MNFNIDKWTKEIYQEYIEYLKKLRDDKYKNFHSKLTTTKYEILGITLPMQRRIAKEICKGDIISFLEFNSTEYYEEVLIRGLVIATIKDKDLFLNNLDNYVLQIDNWGICDSFCNSLKIINLNKEYWFSYFINYLNSDKEFVVRVGLVIFLDFFVEDDYVERIFELVEDIKLDKYYVNMAIAWLLCECFIKFREETLKYLEKSCVNTFTFNKTISKIRDSYRVSLDDKEYLKSLKRKD